MTTTDVQPKKLTVFQASALKTVRSNAPFKPISDKSNVYKYLENRGLIAKNENGYYALTTAGHDQLTSA